MGNEEISVITKIGRWLFLGFTILFFSSVLAQIFFAGLAIFVNPYHWHTHTTYVHLFGFNIPVFLILWAYIGRLPQRSYRYVFGLMFGVFSMYFTANFTDLNRIVGALHPVMAIILFLISYQLLKKTAQFMIINKKGSE